ncbi:MAG TPA: HEAT repeat domain-containing protein, partial [Pirellulales bacterium]
ALEFHDYDMLPTFIQAAEDVTSANRTAAAQHVLKMAEMLYDDLASQRSSAGRDPQLMRRHVLHSLEQSLARFPQHKRSEIIEAFLLLAPRDYPALRKILADPINPVYRPVVDVLTHSQAGGVIRLMLSFLDDPEAPPAAINLLGRRVDLKFVEHFLRKIGSQPSAVAAQNLRRIDGVAWIQNNPQMVDQLDDAAQHGAVQLALSCGVSRDAVFKLIELLLHFGKPAGRRAAAAALAGFHGLEANLLAQEALTDADPQVLVHIIPQLRPRGIAGTLPMLLRMLENPAEVVRIAVRRSLEEFSFDRYLAAFEMLDDSVRQTTGPVVRKVDPTAPQRLLEELRARSRTRRLRGVAIAAAMQLVTRLEGAIIERLADEDHLVRAEAAKALGQARSPKARQALQAALDDRSVIVQEAAEQSLTRFAPDDVVDESLAKTVFAPPPSNLTPIPPTSMGAEQTT